MALNENQRQLILSRVPGSVLKAYQEQEIDDDDLYRVGVRLGVVDPFAEVEGEASTVAVREPRDVIGELVSALRPIDEAGTNLRESLFGGIQRDAGAALFTAQDQGGEGLGQIARSAIEQFNPTTGGPVTGILDALLQRDRESTEDMAGRLYETGIQRTKTARDDSGNWLTKAGSDVLSSPLGYASVIGGPAAGLGAGSVYINEYTAARREGLPEQEATERAASMAGVEGVLSLAPTGKLFGPGAEKALRIISDRAKIAARTGATGLAEGIQESATELAQLGVDKWLSENADSKELRDYAAGQLPKDVTELWTRLKDAGIAGALGGATVGGPMNAMQIVAEQGRLAGEVLETVHRQSKVDDWRRAAREADRPQTSEIEIPGSERAERFRQEDVAWEQRRLERERESNQAAQRTSIERRVDTARERLYDIEARLEDGDTSQATLREASVARRQLEEAETRLSEFEARANAPRPEPVRPARPEPAPEPTPNLPVVLPPETVAANQEAQTLLEKDAENVRKSALSQRQRDRRKVANEALTAARALPEDRRQATVAQTLQEWDAANPIENYLQAAQAAPATQPRGRGRRAPKPAVQVEQEVQDTRAKLNKYMEGLSSETDGTFDTTTQDVAEAVVRQLGSGDANRAARMITQNNIRLVDTDADIPAGAVALGSKGFYDGQQIYVVANALDPNNIVGDLLTVAAHEAKHGGDLSADATLRTTLGEFIGPEANNRLIPRIEALARQGNPIAQQAVETANSTDNYDLELVSYFIEGARNRREEGGPIGRLLGDVVSAARTTAKRIMPGDYDVNLNDVAYLSDRLLTEVAITDPNLAATEGTTDGLQMIVPSRPGDTGTFVSGDQNIKKWITDADSSVRFDSVPREQLTTTGAKLSDVLVHDTLYERHPELMDYDVVVQDELPHDADGMLETGAKRIVIKSDVVNQGDQQYGYPHQLLLHEVQHAVQDIAGWEGGTNPDYILIKLEKPADKGKYNSLRAQVQGVANLAYKGDPDQAARTLSTIYKVPFDMIVKIQDAVADPSTIDAMNRLAQSDNTKALNQLMRRLGTKIIDTLATLPQAATSERIQQDVKALQELDTLEQQRRALAARAEVMYYNNQGEIEARFTQNNVAVRSLANEDVILPRPRSSTDPRLRDARGRAEGGVNPENLYGSEVLRGDEGGNPIAANPELLKDQPLPADPDRVREWQRMLTSPNTLEREFAAFMLAGQRAQGKIGLQSKAMPRGIKIENNQHHARQVIRTFKRVMFPAGGYNAPLLELMRHADQLPAALSIDSLYHGNRLLRAFKHAAKKTGKDNLEIREEVNKRVEEIDKIDDRDRRISAIRALDRDFPGVGTALHDLREYKRSLSRELINLRLRDVDRPLTEKEEATYNKFLENQERYTTRAYLATITQDIGQRYAKNFLKKANTDPNSQEAKDLAAGLEYLMDKELLIPNEEGLSMMRRPEINRLYENWTGKSPKTGKNGREQMIKELSSLPPKTQEQMEAKAVEIVRGLLGMSSDFKRVRQRVLPGMKQNRTILETRSDLPVELRRIMGEITDPYLKEVISIQRMHALMAKTKFLQELSEVGTEKGWVTDARTDDNNQELKDQAYGAMQGKWINKDVADAIRGTITGLTTLDDSLATIVQDDQAFVQNILNYTLPPLQAAQRIQKTTNIVMNVAYMGLNLAGAPAMAIMNGVYNPADWVSAIRDTAMVAGLEINSQMDSPQQLAIVRELLLAGVVDSATMGEFRSKDYGVATKEIERLINEDKLTPRAAREALVRGLLLKGSGSNALRQVYAMMDVWAKVASYRKEKAFLTEYNRLENKGWTDEQIIRQAGFRASGTNVSYERSIPLARAAERNIPFAMFLTYFSETFRAPMVSLARSWGDFQMAREATNPEAARLAYKKATVRLGSTLAVTAGLQAAVLNALSNEDEEEKKRRKLDAPWMQDQVLIEMGRNEDGKIMYFAPQRMDPLGPMNEFVIAVANAENTPQAKAQAAGQAILDMFVEARGFTAVLKATADVGAASLAHISGNDEWLRYMDEGSFGPVELRRSGSTATERNYPETYEQLRQIFGEWGDIGENAVEAVEKLYMPGSLKPFYDKKAFDVVEDAPPTNNIAVDTLAETGRVAAAGGYRPYIRDPDKSLLFRTLDYNDATKHLTKERSDLNKRAANLSAAELSERLLDLREREYEQFVKMRDAYEGYIAHGKSAKEALDIIDNKKIATDLRRGEFRSRLLDPDTLKDWEERAMKEPGADKAEVRKRARMLRRMYREVD